MSVPASYLGVILIWSTTPLAIQWSAVGGGYLYALAARMVIGAALSVALLVVWRRRVQWGRDAQKTCLAAGLGIFFSMVPTYWSAQFVTSGVISLVFGLTPIFTGILARFVLGERAFTPAKTGGIVLGLAGLLGIFGFSGSTAGPTAVIGVAAILFAVFAQSAALVAVKRWGAQVPVLHVNTGALLVATPLFVLTWVLGGAEYIADMPPRAAWAIVYLGVFGSVIGFVLYFYTIKHLTTGTVALITLVTPVLALWLGAWLNGEPVTPPLVFGAVCILSGLALHQWGDVLWRRVKGITR